MIEAGGRAAQINGIFLRSVNAISLLLSTIPLVVTFYSISENKTFFISSAILLESFALMAALSPVCFNEFVSQFLVFSKSALCSPALSETKLRKNLSWAVHELTHVVEIKGKLANHMKTSLNQMGCLKILVAVSALYALYSMQKSRVNIGGKKEIIIILSAFALDFAITFLLISPLLTHRIETSFDACLKVNGTTPYLKLYELK